MDAFSGIYLKSVILPNKSTNKCDLLKLAKDEIIW
jgi:hypothetical protein